MHAAQVLANNRAYWRTIFNIACFVDFNT